MQGPDKNPIEDWPMAGPRTVKDLHVREIQCRVFSLRRSALMKESFLRYRLRSHLLGQLQGCVLLGFRAQLGKTLLLIGSGVYMSIGIVR